MLLSGHTDTHTADRLLYKATNGQWTVKYWNTLYNAVFTPLVADQLRALSNSGREPERLFLSAE